MFKKCAGILALAFTLLIGCGDQKKENKKEIEATPDTYQERAVNMNIYEVNIRQYTPEGTLKAFANHLPRLQQMGVDILWIMPVQPISVKKRKGSLGSYYSISDYVKVDPNYGTLDDFKSLVSQAHELGMEVILDWVANHTGFDHAWTNIAGYHNTDSAGNIISPNPDWSDVADLNYDNTDMRKAMVDAMKWWVTETDIDGFRCDMAGMVPLDFWQEAIPVLEKEKDLFMLAEWDDPEIHKGGFDMSYCWAPFHAMDRTVEDATFNADSLEALIMHDIERYPADAYRMMFITNHDENSWKGTVTERLGKGHKAFAVFYFTVHGMPLIYSGQEAGLNKRLKFFDKDTIDWSNTIHSSFYKQLIALKHNNEALFAGVHGTKPKFITDNNSEVTTYIREKNDNKVVVIINMSDKSQEVTYTEDDIAGTYISYFTNEDKEITYNSSLSLKPYGYLVLIK